MLNFIVKFNTLSGPQKITMTQTEILKDSELKVHAENIISAFDSGVVGSTVQTQSYGRVKLEVEGFERD